MLKSNLWKSVKQDTDDTKKEWSQPLFLLYKNFTTFVKRKVTIDTAEDINQYNSLIYKQPNTLDMDTDNISY